MKCGGVSGSLGQQVWQQVWCGSRGLPTFFCLQSGSSERNAGTQHPFSFLFIQTGDSSPHAIQIQCGSSCSSSLETPSQTSPEVSLLADSESCQAGSEHQPSCYSPLPASFPSPDVHVMTRGALSGGKCYATEWQVLRCRKVWLMKLQQTASTVSSHVTSACSQVCFPHTHPTHCDIFIL